MIEDAFGGFQRYGKPAQPRRQGSAQVVKLEIFDLPAWRAGGGRHGKIDASATAASKRFFVRAKLLRP
jgi:hypothetical protein